MGRPLSKLSDVTVKAAAKTGRLSDGGGLYLSIGPTGGKSWAFVWARDGRKREMGLGAYPAVSLGKARLIASGCRTIVAQGRDPIIERKKGLSQPSPRPLAFFSPTTRLDGATPNTRRSGT